MFEIPKYCPLCSSNGIGNSEIFLDQISSNTAVYVCSNKECFYPLRGTNEPYDRFKIFRLQQHSPDGTVVYTPPGPPYPSFLELTQRGLPLPPNELPHSSIAVDFYHGDQSLCWPNFGGGGGGDDDGNNSPPPSLTASETAIRAAAVVQGLSPPVVPDFDGFDVAEVPDTTASSIPRKRKRRDSRTEMALLAEMADTLASRVDQKRRIIDEERRKRDEEEEKDLEAEERQHGVLQPMDKKFSRVFIRNPAAIRLWQDMHEKKVKGNSPIMPITEAFNRRQSGDGGEGTTIVQRTSNTTSRPITPATTKTTVVVPVFEGYRSKPTSNPSITPPPPTFPFSLPPSLLKGEKFRTYLRNAHLLKAGVGGNGGGVNSPLVTANGNPDIPSVVAAAAPVPLRSSALNHPVSVSVDSTPMVLRPVPIRPPQAPVAIPLELPSGPAMTSLKYNNPDPVNTSTAFPIVPPTIPPQFVVDANSGDWLNAIDVAPSSALIISTNQQQSASSLMLPPPMPTIITQQHPMTSSSSVGQQQQSSLGGEVVDDLLIGNMMWQQQSSEDLYF